MTPTPAAPGSESRHETVTGQHQCACCGRLVSLLVDDGPLCIRCDLLIYPGIGGTA